jgi:hypothetical protein
VSAASLAALTEALHVHDGDHQRLTRIALERLTSEAHAAHAPVELLVSALKTATSASNGIPADELSARYTAALVVLLALYFEEDAE